ncbi:hypothetical protein KUTeg_017746 [Tegillarca granosa]|uniref:IF rod domain-containing protein n=1 Tax=Tegillarca granosa TaxID=220873 RepID=A0ABQ9EFU1_TEGGR|nr:hypothetical protein KUTeg_017744 [Tegillarca granosa]KAJ8304163.1 hypothetical protein KUTeg_017746 [Tegillarca granosa]
MATKTPTPSKSTKKTVTTTTYTTRTFGGEETPSTSTSPGRRARSPSPARITRQQEKEQLQNLNDRLAAYIDKVRFLETENSRLSVQVRSSEETISREVTNVKTLYESELADARKLLDELGKEKAALQIELSKYKEDAEEWKLK